MSLKPRLGDIATPGRVCSPHNEIYDCRIRPNGIGCLRRRSTRRRLGCRPAARPAGQEPVFRADSASERNDLPIRSARFPMKAPGGLQFRQRAEKRERRSKTNSPGIVLSVGRQNRKCGRGESGASASPGARKARATGLRVTQDRSFPTETPDEPGISVKHSATPKPKI